MKRRLSLFQTLVALVGFFAIVGPPVQRVAGGGAAPWIHATTALPLVLLLPWRHESPAPRSSTSTP